MVRFERISIGDGGDLAGTCCLARGPESFRPAAEVLDALASARNTSPSDALNCLLEGVEPFRHPELPVLIAGCVSTGVQRVAVVTDAGALAIPENAAGSLAAGLRQIHVPLYGATPQAHDVLCPSGGFEKTCAGVEMFLKAAERAGSPVVVVGVIPVCEHTLASAPAIVATFARIGAATVRLVVGEPLLAEDPAISAAFETGMVNGVWVWVDGASARPSLGASATRAPMTISEGRR